MHRIPGIAGAPEAQPDPVGQPAGGRDGRRRRIGRHDFARHAAGLPQDGSVPLGANLVESLHLLLTMVAETSQTGDSGDRALLDELTSDRSEMMDGIRKQLLGGAAAASIREAALVATMLFEPAVWLVRELRLDSMQVAAGETK